MQNDRGSDDEETHGGTNHVAYEEGAFHRPARFGVELVTTNLAPREVHKRGTNAEAPPSDSNPLAGSFPACGAALDASQLRVWTCVV